MASVGDCVTDQADFGYSEVPIPGYRGADEDPYRTHGGGFLHPVVSYRESGREGVQWHRLQREQTWMCRFFPDIVCCLQKNRKQRN